MKRMILGIFIFPFAFCIFMSFLPKQINAQVDIKPCLEDLTKKLRFIFNDEKNILGYKSYIFETPSYIDDKYDNLLLNNLYLISGSRKKAFPIGRIHKIKLGIYYYVSFTFESNFTSNQLYIGDNVLNLSDYNDELYKVLPPQLQIDLYLYYAKKGLEKLNNTDSDLKIGYIKGLLKKFKECPQNIYFYEVMAYKCQLEDYDEHSCDSVSYYYEKSLSDGNTDSIFINNYSNWYYSLAETSYTNVDEEKIDQNENIISLLDKANIQNRLNDIRAENFNYMKAFCLYNIYMLQGVKNVDKLKEIEDLLTKIAQQKNDFDKKYNAILLIGNVFDLKGEYKKALESYEEILLPESKCKDKEIIELAKGYREEVKRKVKE